MILTISIILSLITGYVIGITSKKGITINQIDARENKGWITTGGKKND